MTYFWGSEGGEAVPEEGADGDRGGGEGDGVGGMNIFKTRIKKHILPLFWGGAEGGIIQNQILYF